VITHGNIREKPVAIKAAKVMTPDAQLDHTKETSLHLSERRR
jgi:hypothetical protein